MRKLWRRILGKRRGQYDVKDAQTIAMMPGGSMIKVAMSGSTKPPVVSDRALNAIAVSSVYGKVEPEVTIKIDLYKGPWLTPDNLVSTQIIKLGPDPIALTSMFGGQYTLSDVSMVIKRMK